MRVYWRDGTRPPGRLTAQRRIIVNCIISLDGQLNNGTSLCNQHVLVPVQLPPRPRTCVVRWPVHFDLCQLI